METKRQPSSLVALPAETTWASGKPRRARTRQISAEPVKASAAVGSVAAEEHPRRLRTGAEEGTVLAIAKHRAGAWAPGTAARFPARQAIARPAPAAPGVLQASVALVVVASVAAGEGVDSLTKEG